MNGNLHNRVLFLGGESSGKSTITKAVAERTGCFYVSDYGRECSASQNTVFVDLALIARAQVLREISVLDLSAKEGKPFSFYDTSALVTYFYSMELFNKAPDILRFNTLGILRTYNYIFLCENDFPFVHDEYRQDLKFATKQNAFYRHVLTACDIPYTSLSGTIEQRLNTVLNTIGVLDDKV